MSRRLVAALLALVLLGACGGDDPAAESSPSPSPSPSEVAESPSPSPSPSPAAPSPSPSPPSPSPSPSPKRSVAPPVTTVPAAPALETGPAKPGQYLFDEKGLIKTLGCLASNKQPPTPSRLNVAAPNGNRQAIDRDQTGGDVGSLTNAVFEYRDDGAYIVSLKQTQTVAGQQVIIDFEANPPVLAIPSRPTVGQQGGFTLTSRDGAVTIQSSTRVEGVNEQVTLGGGATTRTHKIVSTTKITGNSSQGTLNLTVQRVSWYSPESHLEIKDSTDTGGSVGLCRVDFHIESLARSV